MCGSPVLYEFAIVTRQSTESRVIETDNVCVFIIPIRIVK